MYRKRRRWRKREGGGGGRVENVGEKIMFERGGKNEDEDDATWRHPYSFSDFRCMRNGRSTIGVETVQKMKKMFISMKAKSEQRKKRGHAKRMRVETQKIPRCHVHVSTQTKLTRTAIYPCCQKGNDLRDPFDRQGVIRSLHCFFFWFLTRREQRWTMLRRKMSVPNG